MKPKHFITALLLGLLVCTPSHTLAKKIKYGTTIVYSGKAKKDVPTGEGELMTMQGKVVLDHLKGIFGEGSTVTNAELTFASGWKFTGELSYEVQPDGSRVDYTLTSGEISVQSITDELSVNETIIQILPDNPLKLARLPKLDGCELQTEGAYFKVKPEDVTDENIAPLKKQAMNNLANANIRAFGAIQQVGDDADKRSAVSEALSQKGHPGISDPWLLGLFADKIEMADGMRMECKDEGGKSVWTITYPNGDYFKYRHKEEKARPVFMTKTLADGSKLSYDDSPRWVVTYADKSKLQGTANVKLGNLTATPGQTLSKYNVSDLFNTYTGLTSIELKPYNASLTRADGKTMNYSYGYSDDELAARQKAREEQLDTVGKLTLQPIDVVGEWTMKDPNQEPHSFSYYLLTMTDDGKAELDFNADYYGPWEGNTGDRTYYQSGRISYKGTYQLQDSVIVFKWNDKKEVSLDERFGSPKPSHTNTQNMLNAQDRYLTGIMAGDLRIGNITNISNAQLEFESKAYGSLPFARTGNQKPIQKDDAYSRMDDNGTYTAFKRYYNDGVMTFSGDNNYVIEYDNGDKYVGMALVSTLRSTTNKQMSEAILNVPNLSDMEIVYWTGTLTLADGSVINYNKLMTDRQTQGLQNNLEAAVNDLNALAEEGLKQVRANTVAARQTLLDEGYPARYVNAMFDRYTIMLGTPKELVDRVLELKCHITRHPAVVTDSQTGDKTYAVVIINPNSGEEMFEGYVRFHWLTERVNYFGRQLR